MGLSWTDLLSGVIGALIGGACALAGAVLQGRIAAQATRQDRLAERYATLISSARIILYALRVSDYSQQRQESHDDWQLRINRSRERLESALDDAAKACDRLRIDPGAQVQQTVRAYIDLEEAFNDWVDELGADPSTAQQHIHLVEARANALKDRATDHLRQMNRWLA